MKWGKGRPYLPSLSPQPSFPGMVWPLKLSWEAPSPRHTGVVGCSYWGGVWGAGIPYLNTCNGGENEGKPLREGGRGKMRSPCLPSTSWALHLGGGPPIPSSRTVSFQLLHLGANRKLQLQQMAA